MRNPTSRKAEASPPPADTSGRLHSPPRRLCASRAPPGWSLERGSYQPVLDTGDLAVPGLHVSADRTAWVLQLDLALVPWVDVQAHRQLVAVLDHPKVDFEVVSGEVQMTDGRGPW